MTKARFAAGGVVVLLAAAFVAWKFYPIQLVTMLDRIRNPIAETQDVVWQKGPATPAAGQRPPNIILIVADDLGINDLTATGTGVANGLVPTPNIDALAHEGAQFDTGYAGSATCSPSRAALMTGRYPARFGFEYTAVPKAFARNLADPVEGRLHQPIYHPEREAEMPTLEDMGVPEDQVTIAELLKGKGYRTLHVGKWHLGESPRMRPETQGFDESLGIMFGAGKFLSEDDPDVVNAKLDYDPIDRFLWIFGTDAVQKNGGQRFHVGEYMTDYYTHQAIAAIDANRNRPFFLYLAYNAPHTPLQAKRADYEALSAIKDHKTRVYGAMIRALDRGVGEVVAALKQKGLDDNTLIIFTSDNGGAWYLGLPGINEPYRGWKATFFEGGIRVPFLMRWPGQIAPGQRVAMPAHHLDFFGTAAALAGAELPADRKMDTVNLLPFVTGTPAAQQERTLFWRSGDYKVVRQGQWKLQVAGKPRKAWLFDLATDPTEKVNLADRNPERVKAMKALLAAHDREMPKPIWPALVEDAIRIDVPLDAPWKADQEYVYWAN